MYFIPIFIVLAYSSGKFRGMILLTLKKQTFSVFLFLCKEICNNKFIQSVFALFSSFFMLLYLLFFLNACLICHKYSDTLTSVGVHCSSFEFCSGNNFEGKHALYVIVTFFSICARLKNVRKSNHERPFFLLFILGTVFSDINV